MRKTVALSVMSTMLLLAGRQVSAHCQIPCGIYGDALRVQMLEEHVTTIEKSIKSISELAGKSAPADVNQLVRWIANKDTHADYIAEIVTEYFLRQRIKAPQGDDAAAQKRYGDQLVALHGLLTVSMKAKQTVDPAIPGQLRDLIERLKVLYFSAEDLKHLAEHR